MDEVKPFDIPKREVWQAFKKVKANQGAAGVDGETISEFEADLSDNLYRLWNRMSSGSYFPPPVPAQPKYQSTWTSTQVVPEEVEELIHYATAHMKSRGM